MLRKTAETVLGVTFEKRKGDRDTWCWNEEVQESIKEKKETKKAWDKIRKENKKNKKDENTKKIYKEKRIKQRRQLRWQRNVHMTIVMLNWKQKKVKRSCTDWQGRKTEQKIMYSGNVMVNSEAVLKRWMEYFEKLLNEENNRGPRTEKAEVRIVKDMYEGSETIMRCAVGTTESFKVKVALHQGSALSPFLFAMIMERLTDEVRREPPWTMLFADNIVICKENRKE